MKWFSWFRKSSPDDLSTVVMPAPVTRNTPKSRVVVDWERLDNPAEAEDTSWATGSWESLKDVDPRQRDALEEIAEARQAQGEPVARKPRKKEAYNPYDTSAFKVKYSNSPERDAERGENQQKKKKAYNPYDTGSFHGSWNKIPR